MRQYEMHSVPLDVFVTDMVCKSHLHTLKKYEEIDMVWDILNNATTT